MYCGVLWAFLHIIVVFCELFSTLLWILWCFVDVFDEIKENIYVLSMFYVWFYPWCYLCFSMLR